MSPALTMLPVQSALGPAAAGAADSHRVVPAQGTRIHHLHTTYACCMLHGTNPHASPAVVCRCRACLAQAVPCCGRHWRWQLRHSPCHSLRKGRTSNSDLVQESRGDRLINEHLQG